MTEIPPQVSGSGPNYDQQMGTTPQQPPKPSRSTWIIFAALVIGCALIAGAILVALDGKGAPAGPTPSPTASPPTTSAADSSSTTCKAWKTTKTIVLSIPALPPGWDWDTPNIDTYIGNRTAAIARALDLFEPKIAPNPPDVAAAASNYIDMRRVEIEKLRNHSFSGEDVVNSRAASFELDQLCGTG
ncbi:MAG: hypothetical protein ACPGXI_17515 [Mycobacterium sp.]